MSNWKLKAAPKLIFPPKLILPLARDFSRSTWKRLTWKHFIAQSHSKCTCIRATWFECSPLWMSPASVYVLQMIMCGCALSQPCCSTQCNVLLLACLALNSAYIESMMTTVMLEVWLLLLTLDLNEDVHFVPDDLLLSLPAGGDHQSLPIHLAVHSQWMHMTHNETTID